MGKRRGGIPDRLQEKLLSSVEENPSTSLVGHTSDEFTPIAFSTPSAQRVVVRKRRTVPTQLMKWRLTKTICHSGMTTNSTIDESPSCSDVRRCPDKEIPSVENVTYTTNSSSGSSNANLNCSFRSPDESVRWLPYSPMGSVISGTQFIACKVPLKEVLTRELKEEERFGVTSLLAAYPQLGLLIDLTNTSRYYSHQEITRHNVKYEKIYCPGHIVPANSIVHRFFSIVDLFLKNNSDRLIAVHCTHGVNRTGYFICRYMIERMKISPKEALERFKLARGHEIERINYVDDLMNGCKGGLETSSQYIPNTSTKGQKRRGHDHEEEKADNWRLECQHQSESGNDIRHDNSYKSRKYDSLIGQSLETRYNENPRRLHEPPGGSAQSQWTPDTDKNSSRPSQRYRRNQKVFTPRHAANAQLPHYGLPTHMSYARIRDDDQWNGDGGSSLFNNGAHNPNQQRANRYFGYRNNTSRYSSR